MQFKKNIYVFKQEKPEMDDFKRKKNFGPKGKMLKKNFDILILSFNGYPCKNIFAYSFIAGHYKNFFSILEKNLHF